MRHLVRSFNMVELSMIALVTIAALIGFVHGLATQNALFAGIETIAAVCGICSVVLAAKGKRSGFLFGIINALGYSFISYSSNYYGEVMLNMLFYVPSNIVGFIVWKRNAHKQRIGEVQGRAMTGLQFAGSTVLLLAATFAYQVFLRYLGGSMAALDGFTTLASIFATLLMVSRFAEQWFYWIAVDIVTVIMWIIAQDPVMVVMWGAFLANAVYGCLLWCYKAGKRVPFEPLVAKLAD